MRIVIFFENDNDKTLFEAKEIVRTNIQNSINSSYTIF